MRTCLGVLVALTASASPASGETAGPTLQVGGAAVACGGHPSCRDDATAIAGSSVAEATLPLASRLDLVGHVATTAMPRGLLNESQAIIGLALRRHLGGGLWVEAGAGVAQTRLAVTTIGPADFWGVPCAAGVIGLGLRLAPTLDLAFHLGTSTDERISQATVDLRVHGF
jgi:hypothetical protein